MIRQATRDGKNKVRVDANLSAECYSRLESIVAAEQELDRRNHYRPRSRSVIIEHLLWLGYEKQQEQGKSNEGALN